MRTAAKITMSIALFLPLIVVPYLAYHFNNYWLLFGIPVSLVGSMFANKQAYSPIVAYTLVCFGFWFKAGFNIHQYITFFYFCALFGFFFYAVALEYAKQAAKEHIINQIGEEGMNEAARMFKNDYEEELKRIQQEQNPS